MSYKIEETLEVKKECDVLVAGGGIAGAAAAIAAARLGKKVLLVEKTIKLGGLATLGLVNCFVAMCDGDGHVLGRGMASEFAELACKYGYDNFSKDYINFDIPAEKLEEYKKAGKKPPRYFSHYSAEIFSLCLTELCVSLGIDLMFDTIITNVIKDSSDEKKIEAAVIENKDGRGVILAKEVVDTTGDGDLIYRLGVPTVERGNYHSFFPYEVNFDSMHEALYKKNIKYMYIDHPGGGIDLFGHNQPEDIPLYYGTRNSDINRYIITNHKDLLDSLKNDDRYSRDIVTMPDMCQFRTTRRIESDYVVGEDEHNKHFEDSVCAIADFCYRYHPWEVPFSCLIKTGFPNIITAGRTVGADKYAWDVFRVIPPAILTGQAAGVAASIAIDSGKPIYDIDIKALQTELENEGVELHFDDKYLIKKESDLESTDNK